MERFDSFLKTSLIEYVKYALIDEIIITDETGNDAAKIAEFFKNEPKIKVFKNESRLGPFLNKLCCTRKAKNEWIVLMDSDNFANEEYFKTAKNYIDKNIVNGKNVILSPCKAKPSFNFEYVSGLVYKKETFEENNKIEKDILSKNNKYTSNDILINTGNYVINKYLIDNINLDNEVNNIQFSSACDVIYFNTLLFEQLDMNMHVVPSMEYEHRVHSGSIYTLTHRQFANFNKYVYNRYYKLINKLN
jgi:NDP-sugar pyrophosphorylase family protein